MNKRAVGRRSSLRSFLLGAGCNFLMEEFSALVAMVFLFAFAVSDAIAAIERGVGYDASTR